MSESLSMYALSAPADVEMVRVTALREFEICEGVTADGEIKALKIAPGEQVDVEPDAAAILHRDGIVRIGLDGR